ncbi:MAG TPA: SDR family oxidoreductase [Flavobacteriales bacterium]|nr:SDR family oxidoreductase [Flavobacteriales bacterium]
MKKNILVTGGASGLGRSITELLCENKSNEVYFTYFSSVDAARELEKQFPNAHGIKADFSVRNEMEALNAKLADINLDVLINNALPHKFEQTHFHKMEYDVFVNGFMNNVMPVVELTRAAIALFRKKKSGKIITVLSSYIINKPPIGFSEYAASKAYLLSLAKSWASEYAAFNITSNCISPSFMLTALASDVDERIIEENRQKHPLKRLLTTGETAGSVAYLVDASAHVNGINLVINAAENIAS